MTLPDLIKNLQQATVRNSPAILTALGAVGVGATAYLAGRATYRAINTLDSAEIQRALGSGDDFDQEFTLKEKSNLVWKHYIPPVAVGVLSVTAIIGANRIGARRAAAVATAYAIVEKAAVEYREKVVEVLGQDKEQKLRDEIQAKRIEDLPERVGTMVILGGKQLCYDSFSDRPFESSMEEIKHGINRANHQLLNEGYISLTDYYGHIGVERTKFSDEVGWDSDNLIDVHFTSTLMSDGRTALTCDLRRDPVPDYRKFH